MSYDLFERYGEMVSLDIKKCLFLTVNVENSFRLLAMLLWAGVKETIASSHWVFS